MYAMIYGTCAMKGEIRFQLLRIIFFLITSISYQKAGNKQIS